MKRLVFPFAVILLACGSVICPAAFAQSGSPPHTGSGSSDAPLLSQGPLPELPPAASLFTPPPAPPFPAGEPLPIGEPGKAVSGGPLPPAATSPAAPATASAAPNPAPMPALAPAPIFIPPPPPPIAPPALIAAPQPIPGPARPGTTGGSFPPAAPTFGPAAPAFPAPARFPPQTFPGLVEGSTTSPLNGLHPAVAENIRQFTRAVASFRELPTAPHSSILLRKILRIGPLSTDLLGLVTFPRLHWFQSTPTGTVVRDRSFSAYEYRHYGQFQTRLAGWVKPVATNIHFDLDFKGRGNRRTTVKGVVSADGPLTGNLAITGKDSEGRPWALRLGLAGLLLNDDGYPSGGSIQLSGTDPTQRQTVKSVAFPIPIAKLAKDKRDRRNLRSRQDPDPSF